MPRPLRPLDPAAGPLQAFAAELRKLRQDAGDMKYSQMARKTGKSRTALAEAAGGDHLPTWETVAAFVDACDGATTTWRTRWEQVGEEVRRTRQAADKNRQQSTDENNQPPVEPDEIEPSPNRWRRLVPFVVTALVAAVLGSGITLASVLPASAQHNGPSTRADTATIITVQNKVALGPTQLLEDTTPAYLSTKSVPYCSHLGCELPDTEVSSGALLIAVCHTSGTEMYNYNLDSSASQANPNRDSSGRWYGVTLPGNRSGYISEVYVIAADRGGLGLPVCRAGRT